MAGAGVLIGRGLDCDVVLHDPQASRHHALVHVTPEGPHVVAMGRAPTRVGGEAVDGSTLAEGDRIAVPGLEVSVQVERAEGVQQEPAWVMRVVGGGMFGVDESPLTLGGGPNDDVRFDDLPPAALRLQSAQQRLFVELGMEAVIGRNPKPHQVGEVLPIGPGTVIVVGGHRVQVMTSGRLHTDTTVGPQDNARPGSPTQVHLQTLPRGARLHLHIAGTAHSAYVSDECRELLACLLKPPAPYWAGDLVPDSTVLNTVWPGKEKSSADLNLLLHMLRRDLVRAGLDGVELVRRAPGGGATQMGIGPHTEIRMS
ncbi:MAG: FHA domain-containing protein [Myxococcota bacterium]